MLLLALLATTLASEAPDPDPPLGAALPARERRDAAWDVWGSARVTLDGATPYVIDRLGTVSDRLYWASTRVVVGTDTRPHERVDVSLELEALNGWVGGSASALGQVAADQPFRVGRSDRGDLTRIVPRKAAVGVLVPKVGKVIFGAQTFGWGLGLLSHDGTEPQVFGETWQGNTVARLAFVTAPWRDDQDAAAGLRGLSLFLAGDLVLRDDNALIYDGDLAVSGLLGLRVQTRDVQAGLLGVVRFQRDRQEPWHPELRPETLVFPVDAYGRFRVWERASRALSVAFEAAVIAGRSERVYTEETVQGAAVRSGGALARLQYDDDPHRLTARLDLGWASGDPDPRDGTARAFTMHSDHNVGLVLFDEVLPAITARSADRAADPELSAVPSPGLRHTISQGGVSNAAYLYPTVQVRPVRPLELRLGLLAAWSAADLADVYESAANGGYNTTPGGTPGGGRYLGTEVDLAVHGTAELPHGLRLTGGVEGGVLVAGGALDLLRGEDRALPMRARARIELGW
jgi:hypothetical protein